MQGPLTERSELDRLRDDLSAGRAFSGETVNYRADGTPFEISWRIDPIVDEHGEVTNFVATQQDVTVLRRAERVLAAEALVDRALTAVLGSPSGTLSDVRLVAESVAEAIGVIVPYGEPGVRLVVPTADGPSEVRVGGSWSGEPPVVAGLTRRRSASGASEIVGALDIDDPQATGAIWVAGLRDWEVDAVDLDGVRRLSERVPLVLEAALEYSRRRTAALELQRALLPDIPPLAGLEVATSYVPVSFGAEVGGDFYDALDRDERACFVVGDVAGSGLRVAAEMGRLALVLRGELARHGDAERALAAADELCVAEGLFATATIAIVDRAAATVELRSAGHPPAILRRSGGVEVVDTPVGPPLGAGVAGWPASIVAFAAGDTMALYTDGLVERRDLDVVEGIDLLAKVLARSPVPAEAASEFIVDELTSRHPLVDDTALVVVSAS